MIKWLSNHTCHFVFSSHCMFIAWSLVRWLTFWYSTSFGHLLTSWFIEVAYTLRTSLTIIMCSKDRNFRISRHFKLLWTCVCSISFFTRHCCLRSPSFSIILHYYESNIIYNNLYFYKLSCSYIVFYLEQCEVLSNLKLRTCMLVLE